MAEEEREIVLLQGRKSDVWKYFGFCKTPDSDELDKSQVICTICYRAFKYNSATSSTSNMVSHLLGGHGIRLMQGNKEEPIENVKNIKDAPDLEGEMWQHLGFYDLPDGSGLDYSHAICKKCYMKLRYNRENLYNLRRHLQSYHYIDIPRAKRVVKEQEEELITDVIDDDRPIIDAQSIHRPRSQTYFAAYRHFGFYQKADCSGELDESKVVCKICLHEYSNAGKFHPDYYIDHLKKKHNLDTASTSASDELACWHNPLVKDLPGVPIYKSKVWKYFGFYALPDSQEADKSKAICKLCRRELDYITSGVNSLFKHVNRHGIDLQKDSKERKFPEDVGIFIEAHLTKGANARTTYHSPEWGYFGFYAFPLEDGQNTEVDKSRTVCKLCRKTLTFGGHMSTMSIHLHESHDIVLHPPGKYLCCKQEPIPNDNMEPGLEGSSNFAGNFTSNVFNDSGAGDVSSLNTSFDQLHETQHSDKPLVSMQSIMNLKSFAGAWDYFGFCETADGKIDKTKAICKLCDTSLVYSSSTSNLNKHLRIKHGIYTGGIKREKYCDSKSNESRDKCEDDLQFHGGEGGACSNDGNLSEVDVSINIREGQKMPQKGHASVKITHASPMRSSSKSIVWRYFEFRAGEDGNINRTQVVCTVCNTALRYSSSTTSMRFHLIRVHNIDLKNDSQEIVSKPPTSSSTPSENESFENQCERAKGKNESESYENRVGMDTNLQDGKTANDYLQHEVYSDSDTELILTESDASGVGKEKVESSPASGVSISGCFSPAYKKSKVWNYFLKVETGKYDQRRVRCGLCGSEYCYNGNTSNMSYHLKRYHNIDIKKDLDVPLEHIVAKSITTEQSPVSVKKELPRTDSSDSFGVSSPKENPKREIENYVKHIIDKLSNEGDINPNAITHSSKSESPARYKSKVWEYFEFNRTEEGTIDKSKVVCKHCGHTLAYASSTNGMMNHIEKKHSVKVQRMSTHTKKSRVWEHMQFKRTADGTIDKSVVCCTLCDQEFGYDGSTSNMMKHLLRKHDIDSRTDTRPLKPFSGLSARSKVWDYFKFSQLENGAVDKTHVMCSLCNVILKYKSSTTNMLGHLLKIHNLNCKNQNFSQASDIQKTSASEDSDAGYTEDETSQIWTYFGKFEEEGQIDITKVVCQICYVKVKYFGSLTHMAKHLYSDHDIDVKRTKTNTQSFLGTAKKRRHASDYEVDTDEEENQNFIPHASKQMRSRTRKSVPYYCEDSVSSDENNYEIEEWGNANIKVSKPPEESSSSSGARKVYGGEHVLSNVTSAVWKYFGFYKSVKNPGKFDREYTICRLCHAAIRYTSSTKNMHNHLSKHGIDSINMKPVKYEKRAFCETGKEDSVPTIKGKLDQKASLEMIEIFDDFSDAKQMDCEESTSPFRSQTMGNTTQITDSIAKFICKDLQPFETLESAAFKNLIETLVPSYDFPPKAFFVESIIQGLYEDAKRKISVTLQDNDGLALAGYKWLHRYGRAYMTISGHAVNGNWQGKTFVLDTVEVLDTDSEEALPRAMLDTLHSWKQPRHQKFAVVYDASNLAVNYQPEIELTETQPLYVPCFGQSLNSAAMVGLEVPKVKDVLVKIRYLLGLLRESQYVDLSEEQWVDLKVDDPKEWKSSLEMVQFVCDHRNAIDSVIFKDPEIPSSKMLDKSELTIVREIIEILTPIRKMTELICEVENPIFSLLAPLLNQIVNGLKNKPEDSEFVGELKNTLREKFNSFYSREIMSKAYIASALDPRFKSLVFLTHENRSQIFDQILREAVEIQNSHPLPFSNSCLTLDMDVQTVDEQSAAASTSESDIQQTVISSSTSALSNLFGEIFQNRNSEASAKTPEEQLQSDLAKYQNSDVLGVEGNALQWWRIHEYELPLLARIAKCYLSIPLLCMKAKYLFTNAIHDLVSKRNVINESNLDKQLFLESNL